VVRKPRLKTQPKPEGEWRKKVHPFFIRVMERQKQVEELGRSPRPEDRERAQQLARNPPLEWRKEARELGEDLRRQGITQRNFVGKILDLDLQDESAVRAPTDEQHMLAWLSWYKYGKTWRQLQHERNQGSWKASQRILSVLGDYEKWRFGKLDPNLMRFKMDRSHFNLMAFGLDCGLDHCVPDELADCFDELCGCGRDHDPEGLRKLRTRMLKALDRLDAKTEALKPKNA